MQHYAIQAFRFRRIAAAGLMLVLAAAVTQADTIVGSPGAAWQAFPSALHELGNPYWDSTSWDGSHLNVGYLLSNLQGLTPPWWGNANGSADPGFYFTSPGPDSDATLHFALAGRWGSNEFGWYDPASPAVLHPIIMGGTALGTQVNWLPSADYGFYLKTPEGGSNRVYYTESSRNPAGETGHQHFAVFAESLQPGEEVYWIGVEDLRAGHGDEDYQDMVVRVHASPEPATFLLLGGGLAVIWVWRRRARG